MRIEHLRALEFSGVERRLVGAGIAALFLAVWLPLHLARWYRLRRRPPGGTSVATYVPPSARDDARNRAYRTFVQGLLVDVAAGVVLAVGPALAGEHFAWSAPYWTAIGLLAAKTAVQTGVSYVGRHLVPPQP